MLTSPQPCTNACLFSVYICLPSSISSIRRAPLHRTQTSLTTELDARELAWFAVDVTNSNGIRTSNSFGYVLMSFVPHAYPYAGHLSEFTAHTCSREGGLL
jgi:hypothetical protein